MNKEEIKKILDNHNYQEFIKSIKDISIKDVETVILNNLASYKDVILPLAINLSNKGVITKEWSIFLARMMMKYKDGFYNYTFACEIKYAPIEHLYCNTVSLGNMTATGLFLSKYEDLDVSELINYYKDNGSIEDIVYILRKYPTIPRKELYKKVLQGSAQDIYTLCANVLMGTEISIFEDKIITLNDALYVYLFAKDVKKSNKEKLGLAILKTYNSKYIYLFTKEFDVLDEKLILNYLDNADDYYYIYLYYKENYHISLNNFLEYIINRAEVLKHFKYEDRLKYLIYMLDNKSLANKDIIDTYRNFLMEEKPTDKMADDADKTYQLILKRGKDE